MAEYPAVLEHLNSYKDSLLTRATINSHEWFELQQPQMGIFKAYLKPKIVYQNVSRYYKFAFDTEGFFPDMNIFVIPTNDLYLMGILASNPMRFFAQSTIGVKSGGFLVLKTMFVQQFPIPNSTKTVSGTIKTLINFLLHLASIDTRIIDILPNTQISSTFFELLNGCAYELYFPDALRRANADVCWGGDT